MRRHLLLLIACWLAIQATARAQLKAEPGGAGSILAARSLRHDARGLIHAPANTTARGGRLVTLAYFAERMQPQNVETQYLLAGVYELQDDSAAAAAALDRCLQEHPRAWALGLRWLEARLGTLHTAEDRLKWLESVGQSDSLPEPLRAEAYAQRGRTRIRQGQDEAGLEDYARALELDPQHPEAIRSTFELQRDLPMKRRVELLLSLLRSNPLAVNVAWEIATRLNALGLHDASVELFAFASEVADRRRDAQTGRLFITEYLNAMLDAGQAAEALERLAPRIEEMRATSDLQSLLIEAYRLAGQEGKAETIADAMAQRHREEEASMPRSSSRTAERAWFYTVIRPEPRKAAIYARRLPAEVPPAMARIRAVARLSEPERAEQARQTLAEQAPSDAYAAALLARHYYENDQDAAGRETLLSATGVDRGGPGWRMLRRIADEHNVELPPADGASEVRQVWADFDKRYLTMARQPEEFLSVEFTGPEEFTVGSPMVIGARLTNTGPVEIPVGPWGLLNPVMMLHVEPDDDRTGETFDHLPLLVWHAPRYLQPGENITAEVPLDVGRLGRWLASQPFGDVSVRVVGVLDPIRTGEETTSALAKVPVESLRVTRKGLLTELPSDASPEDRSAVYDTEVVARLARIIRQGRSDAVPAPERLAARVRAARQVAALLSMYDRVLAQRLDLGPGLQDTVKRPMMLSMLRALLADPSPVVRAEMIAALRHVELDGTMLLLLKGSLQDPSSLVRLRAAELIGVKLGDRAERVLRNLSKDNDELVARMAKVFLAAPETSSESRTQPATMSRDSADEESAVN